MNDEQYVATLNNLHSKDKLEELYDLQREYMREQINEFISKSDGSTEYQICIDLLEYAYNDSISGNALIYLSDYELSESENRRVIDVLENGYVWEKIGHYLLDDESYEDENGEYIVDVMFGGAYVPEWDGWTDGTMN